MNGDGVSTLGPPQIAAVIFDVDGTLYDQAPVRRGMALELISAHLLRPATGWRLLRFLSAYRQAQETLRGSVLHGNAPEVQLLTACQASGASHAQARAYLDRWFYTAPLKYVRRAVRPGVYEFLTVLKSHGKKLGVLSDYPATAKLEALGFREFFDAVVGSDDAGVVAFKPDPSGLLLCAQKLGVPPQQVLYIGDRPAVDAECARRAGASAAIVEPKQRFVNNRTWLSASSFPLLLDELMRRQWLR